MLQIDVATNYNFLYCSSCQMGEWCLSRINSPEYVSWLFEQVASTRVDREVLVVLCSLTHILLTAPCLSLFQCRLMYGVVGRQQMLRAMWALLVSMYPQYDGSSGAGGE